MGIVTDPDELNALAQRYADFVYAAAARQMPDDLTGAQDAAQAAMIVLIRKGRAGALPQEKYMTGWLLRVTRYSVLAIRRSEKRRTIRELESANPQPQSSADQQAQEREVRTILDEAILQLNATDREAIVRRYLRQESIATVAQAIGANENTAGRRITRALEKLRKEMLGRGVAAPAALVVAVMASESAVKAPAAIASALVSAKSVVGIVKSVLWQIALPKICAAAAISASVIVVGASAVIVIKASAQTAAPVQSISQSQPEIQSKLSQASSPDIPASPLNPDGKFDYVAAINQKYGSGVTPENNGFVPWINVIGTDALTQTYGPQIVALSHAQGPFQKAGIEYYKNSDELDYLRWHFWKPKDHPVFAAYIAANEQRLALATAAAKKPRWWEPAVSGNGTAFDILLPYVSGMSRVAETLCARAMLRADQGDFDGYSSDLLTAKRLARHASGFSLVERRVMTGVNQYANQALGQIVGSGIVSGARCAQLSKSLDSLLPMPPVSEVVDGPERWIVLDLLQNLAEGRSGSLQIGLNVLDRDELKDVANVRLNAADFHQAVQHVNGCFDRLVKILQEPNSSKMRAECVVFQNEIQKKFGLPQGSPLDRISRLTDKFVIHDITAIMQRELDYRAQVMQDELLRVLIAAARYYADKGQWPGDLKVLVPNYLAAIPVDRFSLRQFAPVKCIETSGGFLVYSVGLNGVDEKGANNPDGGPDDIAVGAPEAEPIKP